jgi:hypothetical protein
MAHTPVNHPARPVYRAIGGLTGLYLAIFGGLGVIETSGSEFFAQDDTRVLGQGSNLGYSVVSLALGVLILVAVGIGRNLDARLNKFLGYGFMALGLACLAVLRTDGNVLNFSVNTCMVAMLVGLVLMMAGMYGKTGTEEEARASQHARLFL